MKMRNKEICNDKVDFKVEPEYPIYIIIFKNKTKTLNCKTTFNCCDLSISSIIYYST